MGKNMCVVGEIINHITPLGCQVDRHDKLMSLLTFGYQHDIFVHYSFSIIARTNILLMKTFCNQPNIIIHCSNFSNSYFPEAYFNRYYVIYLLYICILYIKIYDAINVNYLFRITYIKLCLNIYKYRTVYIICELTKYQLVSSFSSAHVVRQHTL